MKKCEECGNEVSTKAEFCPKCGAVQKNKKSVFSEFMSGVNNGMSGPPSGTREADLKNKTGCIGAVILILFIIGIIRFFWDIGLNKSKISSTSNPPVSQSEQSTSPPPVSQPEQKSKNPPADITSRDFAKKCGAQVKHEIFEKTCKGKTVLLEGIITDADSNDEASINIGDEVEWDVELDNATPRYKKGTRVRFSATLDEQMGWGARMKNGHFWEVLSVAGTAKKKQKDGSVSTGPDKKTGNPTEDFTKCLLAEAKNDSRGKLSSYDGGTSAMQLMVQCKATWYAYLDECIQETHKTEGDCNVQAAILAQSALKLLEK